MGVDLDGPFVKLAEDVDQGVFQLLASGLGSVVTLGRLADDEQPLGALADLVASGVVAVDEPFPGVDRLVDLAFGFEQPGGGPSRGEVVGVDLQRFGDVGAGALVVADGEVEVGESGAEVGVLGLVLDPEFEGVGRLLVFPLTGQRVGTAEDDQGAGGGGLVGGLGERVEGFHGLGVSAVLQEPAGRCGVRRVVGRLGEGDEGRGDDDAGKNLA